MNRVPDPAFRRGGPRERQNGLIGISETKGKRRQRRWKILLLPIDVGLLTPSSAPAPGVPALSYRYNGGRSGNRNCCQDYGDEVAANKSTCSIRGRIRAR
jgi:hypothetical protein